MIDAALDKRVSPASAIAASLIGSALLLYQIVKTESYPALVLVFAALVVGCLPRPILRHALAASLAPAVLAVALSRGALLVKDPLTSIHAQDPGQDLVIALMVGLLALAIGPKKSPAIACGALVLLSLPFHGVALLAIAVETLATRSPRPPQEKQSSFAFAAAPAVLSALLALVSLFPRPPRVELAPEDPRAAVEYWRTRENLFRARHVALDWATKEPIPREGYLTLAIIDWDLGEHDKAQKVLTKVIARTDDSSILERANALATAWGRQEETPAK